MHARIPLIIAILFLSCKAWCQDGSSPYDKAISLPDRFLTSVNRKATTLQMRLTTQSRKYLQRMARREQKLYRQLLKTDSSAAKALSADMQGYTAQLQQINTPAKTDSAGGVARQSGAYQPYADSLQTALAFLQQHHALLSSSNNVQQVSSSLQAAKGLQSKLQESDQVKAFISQRKQLIRDLLSRNSGLPGAITRSYNEFSKEEYYYSQQVNEIRSAFDNPDKLLQKTLELLNQVNGFSSFMQQYGSLAGMFGVPANYGSAAGLAGLQTRDQLQQLLQNRFAAAGPGLRQSLQSAEAQFNALKDKLPGMPFTGNASAPADMPGFAPNNQKTKTFLKRLEYGSNLQTVRSDYFFPTTSDIGLSVGYKLNDKSTVGVGASAKTGWGKDIRHIAVTMEGVGLRSFVDIRLKGSFYVSGGYEYNYQPTSILAPGGEAGPVPAWQPSGLAGISKLVSLKSKLFKKTKLQLFWDFLGYRQVPRGQPLKFRVGYVF